MTVSGTIEESVKIRFEDRGNERALLSCILRYPDLLIDVQAKLRETDFLSPHHRALYSTLCSLNNKGVNHFDLVVVVNALEERNMLGESGGPDYINALFETNVDRSNAPLFMDKLLSASVKFSLYKQTKFIESNILQNIGPSDDHTSADDLVAQAESRLLEVSMESKRVDDAVQIGTGLIERLQRLASNPTDVVGLYTGIPLLDSAMCGLSPGSLTVVAARQKAGKSTLLMGMAANIVFQQRKPILYVDTEMSTEEVQLRLLSHLSRVPEKLIKTGRFIENEIQAKAVWAASEVIKKAPLYHRFYPGFTADGLRSLARKYRTRHNIEALFFDYIKMDSSSDAKLVKEHQALGFLTTSLKDTAGILSIPVITAAQIKRESSDRTKFSDSSVADSDRIGRYCNTLLALGQKSKDEVEQDGLDCGTHRLQILLNRGGESLYHGIDLQAHLPTLTFKQARFQVNGIPSQ